jgi:hypothetical protein
LPPCALASGRLAKISVPSLVVADQGNRSSSLISAN